MRVEQDCLTVLANGEISSVEGRFLWGSNYTFLVSVSNEIQNLDAVYKPTQGEQPLWDFPADTLALRETAAYLVCREIGWHFVPPTVYRENGPLGPGSLQLFIEHDPEYHFFNFSQQDKERLRPYAAFDILVNNADRKGGHFLKDPSGFIWGIDHGVCFHETMKLRTVLWDFAGEKLPEEILTALTAFQLKLQPDSGFYQELQKYLSEREITSLTRRLSRLIERGVFPYPPRNTRPYPWPLV